MIRIAITPAAYVAIAGTLADERRQRDRPAGHPAKPGYRRARSPPWTGGGVLGASSFASA
jgi:hypothetical protein